MIGKLYAAAVLCRRCQVYCSIQDKNALETNTSVVILALLSALDFDTQHFT